MYAWWSCLAHMTSYVHSILRFVYGVATIRKLLRITCIFAQEPYKRDYILQKRSRIWKSLLIVVTPCLCVAICGFAHCALPFRSARARVLLILKVQARGFLVAHFWEFHKTQVIALMMRDPHPYCVCIWNGQAQNTMRWVPWSARCSCCRNVYMFT